MSDKPNLPPWGVTLKEHIETQFELRDRALLLSEDATLMRVERARSEAANACSRLEALELKQANQEGKASQSSVTQATILAVIGLCIGLAGLLTAD